MQRRFKETDSSWVREEMERFQDTSPCEVCKGYRLKPEALAVKIGGLHIGQVVRAVDPAGRHLVPRSRQEAEQAAAARSRRAS